jgi:hypothetical protein
LNFAKGTLFNRVNEVDPLVCPKCNGQMRIIAFIEEQEIIKTSLTHLEVYVLTSKARLRARSKEVRLNYSYSQAPASDDSVHGDPDLPPMLISSDSKRGQGATESDAPGFQAMLRVPARNSPKPPCGGPLP